MATDHEAAEGMPHPTEEEFFNAMHKCFCGNSFTSATWLAMHVASAHITRPLAVPKPKRRK